MEFIDTMSKFGSPQVPCNHKRLFLTYDAQAKTLEYSKILEQLKLRYIETVTK